jgi:gliding motility-associated-like protein
VQNIIESNVKHPYARKGNFIISLVLSDENGCRVASDNSERITISDTSKIEMKNLSSCLFIGDPIEAIALSENQEDIQWVWEMNEVAVGTQSELQTIADHSGQYILTLNGINQNGCLSKITNPLSVQSHLHFIPNVITPNNDGLNDSFEVNEIGDGQWNFLIYNRWGNLVYKENFYQGGWNGNGLDAGVYYYSIQNATCNDKIFKGPVSIIR